MLYGFLLTLFIINCFLLMLVILVQKGKGSMGLGGLGGGSQMLFGGGGGQDIFQKITWFLGAIFVFGSLALSLMRSHESRSFRYIPKDQMPMSQPAPEQPAQTPASK